MMYPARGDLDWGRMRGCYLKSALTKYNILAKTAGSPSYSFMEVE